MDLRAVGLTLVAVTIVGSEASGQASSLERWTLGSLAESWSPRWSTTGGTALLGTGAVPELRVAVTEERIALARSFSRAHGQVEMGLRVPIDRVGGVRMSGMVSSWRTDASERPFLATERSAALSLGADVRTSSRSLGRWGFEVLGGWDGGLGGLLRAASGSAHHRVVFTGWRTHARESIVFFPVDSLRDMGAGERVTGSEADVAFSARGLGLDVRSSTVWRRERLDSTSDPPAGFLTVEPGGWHTQLETMLEAGTSRWAAHATYRARSASVESRILRAGIPAGRLPLARMELWGWRAGFRVGGAERAWSFEGGSDQLAGALSARVETWPFVSLWESLSAQAYRLNGDLTARSTWVRMGREGAGSIDWTLEAGHYRLRLDRDSWYVTSLGFGRSDRQRTRTEVDPAILIGGKVAWKLTLGAHALAIHLDADVPIHARHVDASDIGVPTGPPDDGTGLAGSVGIVVEWTR